MLVRNIKLIIDYVSGNIDQLDANLASMGWTSFANSLKIENCDITRRANRCTD